jgi:hypothetical protein
MHDAAYKKRPTPPRLTAFEGSRGNPQILAMNPRRPSLKSILGLAVSAMMLSPTVMAAQNSQTFYLATAARAGNVQLPRGICELTWSTPSGSRVRLNIKTEDQKTAKVLARVVEGNQGRSGVVTSIVGGITYLQELHTKNATFILQNGIKAPR